MNVLMTEECLHQITSLKEVLPRVRRTLPTTFSMKIHLIPIQILRLSILNNTKSRKDSKLAKCRRHQQIHPFQNLEIKEIAFSAVIKPYSRLDETSTSLESTPHLPSLKRQ